MNTNREKQILSGLPEICSEKLFLNPEPFKEDVDRYLRNFSEQASVNIIFVSGNRSPTIYIGPRSVCFELAGEFLGEVHRCHSFWYWKGYLHSGKITELLHERTPNPICRRFSVPEADLDHAAELVLRHHRKNLLIADERDNSTYYLGSWSTANRLKQRHGGRMKHLGNYWAWHGNIPQKIAQQTIDNCNKKAPC